MLTTRSSEPSKQDQMKMGRRISLGAQLTNLNDSLAHMVIVCQARISKYYSLSRRNRYSISQLNTSRLHPLFIEAGRHGLVQQ